MEKKEFKKYVNENGFFLHINSLEKLEQNFIKENEINTPKGENIITFSGLASQTFKRGEVSRNGYKIDPNGWNTENYMKNPQILLSHNNNEPIGKALSIKATEKGLEINFYINLDWVRDEADKNRLKDGAFTTLSTGHITKEYKFENKESGEILLASEAKEKYGLSEMELVYSEKWDFIVSQAELIEVSMVTTPSNPDTIAEKNIIESFKKNIIEKLEKEEEGDVNSGASEEVKEKIEIGVEAENVLTVSENGTPKEKEILDENSLRKDENSLKEEVELKKDSITLLKNDLTGLFNENEILKENIQKNSNLLEILANTVVEQAKELNSLKSLINTIPQAKGVMFKKEEKEINSLAKFIKS